MKTQRAYSMELRAAAAEATRERILEAAAGRVPRALVRRCDDRVRREAAGVSGQTVINHFGGKEGARRRGVRPRQRGHGPKALCAGPGDLRGAGGGARR